MKAFLKASIKILVSVTALYYVFTKIQFSEVLKILTSVNYFLLFTALAFFIFSKIVSAWRLNLFFSAMGIRLQNKSNLKLYILGMYYNLFLPGGIGGDGYKVYFLNKQFKMKVKELFWAVMLDRVNGVFALFLLALMMVPFLRFDYFYTFIALSLIPFSILLYVLIKQRFFKLFYQVTLNTTLLSVCVQILQLISAILILFSYGSSSNILAYLFLFLISSIVAALPFTIGGIGSREITFLFGAKLLHLDINLSIALSLLFYIITLVVSFFGIYFSINTKALDLKKAEITS